MKGTNRMTMTSRRDFIAALAAASGAGTCLCAAGGCATFTKVGRTPAIAAGAYDIDGRTLRIRLEQVPELAAVGGAVKLIDARLPVPLIVGRTGDAEYAAVSLLCPHRGVEVEYRHKAGDFRCASLGHSTFGKDGGRRGGPARKPLRRFGVKPEQDGSARVLTIDLAGVPS